ncbi:MAG: caspase family protein [Sphaerochaeta sp.]|jgi:hypothetical protein
MRRMLIFLLLSILLLASCELVQDQPPQGKVYGVFIGLDYRNTTFTNPADEYGRLLPLKGTLNDAREMKTAFGHIAGLAKLKMDSYLMYQEGDTKDQSTYEMITVGGTPIRSYASKANLALLLDALADVIEEEDLLILTYHGHGGEDVLFMAPESNDDYDIELKVTEKLLKELQPIKGRKLVILDSCESGMCVPASESSVSLVRSPSLSDWFDTYFSDEPYAIPPVSLFTATAHTDSYEMGDDHIHGVFTLALLEALGGSHDEDDGFHMGTEIPAKRCGVVTVDSLYAYVKKHQELPLKTTIYRPTSMYQHPMTNGGAMDFILFRL